MSNLLKSKTFKVGGLVIAIAMMLSVVAVSTASAQTTTVNAPAFTYSGLMKSGMSGPGISTLQAALNSVNAGGTIVVDGKFGPATASAVRQFQMSHGLTADGVVGPMTGAALAAATYGTITVPTGPFPAGCSSASGYSTTTGMPCSGGSSGSFPAGCSSSAGYSSTTGKPCSGSSSGSNDSTLSGGETDISDINVNDADDDTINEGSDKAPVAEIEFDVDDADAKLVRADVVFQSIDGQTSPEDKPWRVFDKVYLMDGSTTVASMDSDDEDMWDDASDDLGSNTTADAYRIRFNNINEVYNEGDTGSLWVAVDIASSVDGSDSGDAEWAVGLDTDGLRFTDGAGLDTFAETTDIAEFSIQESGGDSEFSVTEDSSSPDASSLEVKANSSTTVTLAIFNADADEDGGDVKLVDFPVGIKINWVEGSAADATDFTDIIDEIIVEIDGQEYTGDYVNASCAGDTTLATCSDDDTATFVFDDIDDDDIIIEAGDELNVTVKAKLRSQGASGSTAYANGTTIQAFAKVGTNSANVEDADTGDDIGDVSGNATADVFTLFSDGISAELTGGLNPSITENDDGDNTKLTYNLTFEVSAFGHDVYVPKAVAETSSASAGLIYEIETSGGIVDTTETDATNGSLQSSADEIGSDYYLVEEGETETFTVTISLGLNSVSPTPGFYHVQLNAIQFSTTNQDGSPESSYTLSPENDFDTNDGQLDAV